MQCFTGFVFAFFFARFFCCKIVCIFFESTCFLSDIAALFLASFGLLLVECSQIIILGFILCKSLNLYSIFLFYFYWRQLFPHNTNSCVGLPPPKRTSSLEVNPCTHLVFSLPPGPFPFPTPFPCGSGACGFIVAPGLSPVRLPVAAGLRLARRSDVFTSASIKGPLCFRLSLGWRSSGWF